MTLSDKIDFIKLFISSKTTPFVKCHEEEHFNAWKPLDDLDPRFAYETKNVIWDSVSDDLIYFITHNIAHDLYF